MNSSDTCRCIIVSAPSGAGKTTIVRHLLSIVPQLEFSVSACSRPMREGERDGTDYHFIGIASFQARIEAGDFVEWQEVYPGSYYGTLKSELERIWKEGKYPIFDVDVFGGINLKKIFGKRALSLFIMPPSMKVLEERLRKRASDSPRSLKERLAKARLEIKQAAQFDVTIINDDLAIALTEAEKSVHHFLTTSDPPPTSDIPHPTSHLRHPTSDIRHPTSDIPHPTSDIPHPTSETPPTSDIPHPTSDIPHPTSETPPTSDIPHPT